MPFRFSDAVSEALAARRRYRELLTSVRPGPMQERLEQLGTRLDAGVQAVWDAARRAGEIETVLATLDPERVTAEYKDAKRSDVTPELMAAYEARFNSVQRLLNALDDTDERLHVLQVRLGGVVAQAASAALTTSASPDAATGLDAELNAVVDELGALRVALDDLS